MEWFALGVAALVALYLGYCLKSGTIRCHGVYRRDKNPFWFWWSFATDLLIVLGLLFAVATKRYPATFGCDPKLMQETSRCIRYH
jgi:hypothetical protein